MIRYGMLKRFLVVWSLYWLFYLFQPVEAIHTKVEMAWLIQLLFVMIFSCAYIIGASMISAKTGSLNNAYNQLDHLLVGRTIKWGLWISLLGLCFLVFDKITIQGIDYTQGIAIAREQWRVLGESRDGEISSPFSVLGYLFGGAFFLSLGLTLSRSTQLSDSRRMYYILFGFTLLMSHSLLTGGRSSLLLALGFLSFGYFSSKYVRFPPLWSSYLYKMMLLSILLFAGLYILFVFYSRATMSGVDLAIYSIEFLEWLGLKPSPWFKSFATSSDVGAVFAVLNLAISYLTHSLASTAAILEQHQESGLAIFMYLISIGAKLGLLDPPAEWFLAGRFPSLPGALYMQWGLWGMLFATLILGTVSGFASSLFERRRKSITIFLMCACLESVVLLSPFVFAGDLLFFPFILLGGLIVIFMNKLFRILKAKP